MPYKYSDQYNRNYFNYAANSTRSGRSVKGRQGFVADTFRNKSIFTLPSLFISFWFKIDAWQDWDQPFGIGRDGSPNNTGFTIKRFSLTQNLECTARGSSNATSYLSFSGPDSKWHHLTFWMNVGSPAVASLDGSAQEVISSNNVQNSFSNVDIPISLFASPTISIADCAIWSPESQPDKFIRNLLYKGVPAYKIPLKNLLFYQPCNDTANFYDWITGEKGTLKNVIPSEDKSPVYFYQFNTKFTSNSQFLFPSSASQITELNQSVSFFIQGKAPTNGDISLYTGGLNSNNGDISLYTGGVDTPSGNFPLYLDGNLSNTNQIPLVVGGEEAPFCQKILFPQSTYYNYWRYSSNPIISGVHIYEPKKIHSLELDLEPDLGPGSPAQYLNGTINNPVDANGIILQYTESGIKNLNLNFDVTFSRIASSPTGSGGPRVPHNLGGPYIAFDVRGSGLKVGDNYPSGYLSNPLLEFKSIYNPAIITENIVICSSLYYPTESRTFDWPNSRFENSRMYMEVVDNYDKINQGVPEALPSLSGSLNIWYPDEFKISEVGLFFYCNNAAYSGSIPLYTKGHIPYSTGIPLFIKNEVTPTGLPLYLENSTAFDSIDLFIKGMGSKADRTDLFTIAGGNFLYKNIPLYISGIGPSNDNITLFTLAGSKYDSTSLFEYGSQPINNDTTLFTSAAAKYNQIPLFEYGKESANSGITLFIHGYDEFNSGISLFTKGSYYSNIGITLHTGKDKIREVGAFNFNSIPVTMYSETNPTLFATKSLYIEHQDWYPDPRYKINLHTTGPKNLPVIGSMNLHTIYGNNNPLEFLEDGIELFLNNGWLQSYSGVSLNTFSQNMDGDGGDDSVPYNDKMILFMSRDADSFASSHSLFLKSLDLSSGNIPFYSFGSYSKESGLEFFIKGYSTNIQSVNFYNHGF